MLLHFAPLLPAHRQARVGKATHFDQLFIAKDAQGWPGLEARLRWITVRWLLTDRNSSNAWSRSRLALRDGR